MLSSQTVIGVCGAGAMGAGIAEVAAAAGHPVVVLDRDEAALERGRSRVAASVRKLAARGKISDDAAAALADRIIWTTALDDLRDAGLVIEAIIEDRDAKTALFRSLETVVAADAVIATNTSSLSVSGLAGRLDAPARFLGLHFFNPAPVMKLVEVAPGLQTDAQIVERALGLMEEWGKVAVRAKDVPGFIVNRVARPFYGEGWRAFEEGAGDAASLDYLFRDLGGFRMGPLELGDLIGHDINAAAARSVFDAYGGRVRFAPSLVQKALVESGRLGRKSGAGVYEYGDDAETPAPLFEATGVAAEIKFGPQTDRLRALLNGGDDQIRQDASLPEGFAVVGGALVGFSTGLSAGAGAAHLGAPVALLDWGQPAAKAIGFAASCEEAAVAAQAFAFAAAKKCIRIKDRSGLVVLRAWLQLLNAAADAARDGVGLPDDIDRAMRFGVNYPAGPFAWGEAFGLGPAVAALEDIARETGDSLYQPNEVLRAMARAARGDGE